MHRMLAGLWRARGSTRNAAIESDAVAPSIRRGPILSLVLCGGLLVAAVIVGTMTAIGEFRERALSNQERELQNTVLLLTRHFDQQFEDTEIIANDVISRMQFSAIDSPETFRKWMSSYDAHLILKSKVSVLSYVGDVGIFDSDGKLINSSGTWPIPPINVAERAFFKQFKSDASLNTAVVEPSRNQLTGNSTTVIAHRLSGPNGIFLGVMARRIEPVHFEKYFASVMLGNGSAISMFHHDGTMLARYPHVESMVGQKFRNTPLLDKVLREGGRQTLRVQSPVDGMDRLGSAAALNRFPIVVVATTTFAAALDDWYAQTRFMVAAAVLSALVIAFILFLIIRQVTRQNQEAQQRLSLQKQQLDTALNNMTQGLVLYDASARIILCNRRYIDMYRLSTDIVKPGCHFRDLIQHRQDTGSYDGDVDEFCSAIIRNVAQGKVTHMTMESAGRSYLIVNKPLTQGGWVATIEDTTERQNLQQERDRNYAFLRQIIDHIPTQITVKDLRDGRYVLANRVAETQFGMSREEIVGKTAFDLFPKQVADSVTSDDEKAINRPDGLFLDVFPSQIRGQRYITSKRIGIPDQTGETRYLINVVDDVTERRRADERIAHLAHYDALTDLPNRVLFRDQIERELQRTSEGEQFALLYIDIDEFKGINDSLGHHVGDELLKAVAGRIRNCIGESDLIARLGGDEFAVIQTGVRNARDVVEFVTRIHESIRQPYQCLGHQLSTDASIGIALAPQDGTDLDQLIKNADLAMYGAKAGGRRTHRFFEPAMDACAKARLAMEQDLRQALVDGGFEIHYQPLVDLRRDEVTGCEALLRWRHPERGMISPAEFVPVAEDTGLIIELGEWVLKTACAEAAIWPDHIRVAVNVSPVQLKCPTLATLHRLKALGVRIAMDDFGTGYSSLSYLHALPFSKLKIDRSFVMDIGTNPRSLRLLSNVAQLGKDINLKVTAEGVETEEQLALIQTHTKVDQIQGYLFGVPLPARDTKELMRRMAAASPVEQKTRKTG